MTKIIGIVTRYQGTERRHLRGQAVEIVAVVKNALASSDTRIITTDEEIAETGGITTLDRVIVAVIALGDEKGRMGGAVKAVDLAYFQPLLRTRGTA